MPPLVMLGYDVGHGGWPAFGLHKMHCLSTGNTLVMRWPGWPTCPRKTNTKPTKVSRGLVDRGPMRVTVTSKPAESSIIRSTPQISKKLPK